MSPSHQKKDSIPSLEEYYRPLDRHHDAYDRIQAGEAGSGYGTPANGRNDAVHRLKQLLDEYEINELGSAKSQSDKDDLRQYGDL